MTGLNLEKHFSLISSVNIQEICDPLLNSIGITYFNYIKIYNKDSSRELLTNNPTWIGHFYKNALYNSVGAVDIEHLMPRGYFLWSELDVKDPIYIQGRDYFNIDNGITFIIKREDVTYLYIFASGKEKNVINNFYAGNIDLLKRFIHYFTDKASSLIKEASKNKIYLPHQQTINNNRVNNIDLNDQVRNDFLEKTKNTRYFLLNESDDLYLTHKQAQCISFALKGCSSKQIAKNIGISHRTVESYLFEIKDKVRSKIGRDVNKQELLKILRQSNIV